MASDDHARPASRVPGEIRVEGMLRLAPDTLYEGDVHAPGGLLASPGSIVAGDVYTDGTVQLAATARIGGRVRPAQNDACHPRTRARDAWEDSCPLRRLLTLAEQATLCEQHLTEGLTQLQENLLEHPPSDAWSFEAVRDQLFGQGFARLAPVTIEQEADGAYLLRIRRQGDPGDESRGAPRAGVLADLACRLGETARPGLSLYPLSSGDTPGDVVLLVED